MERSNVVDKGEGFKNCMCQLPYSKYVKLKKASKVMELSISELIRRAIDKFLESVV